MVGPLQTAPGGFTHLFVTVDKFSKWIEARPVTTIRSEEAVKFFTDIVHHFGVPNSIITDNGTQFTGSPFLEFCDDHNIRVDWASVAHPRTNGQVERANGMILRGLKPRIFSRLKKFAGQWVEELPSVLWSLRTSKSRATGFTPLFMVYGAEAILPTDLDYGSPRVEAWFTPFFMVYGAEAILPTDLDYGSPRVEAYDPQGNEANLQDALDQLDEAQDVALLHSAKYQQALRRYHSRRVQGRSFNVGDLVLRLIQTTKGRHKLSPPWEVPYVVSQVLRPGTYKLQTPDGEEFTNAWNIEQLHRFYP
ncbi:unnamed protein product [Urochloa humidicola]